MSSEESSQGEQQDNAMYRAEKNIREVIDDELEHGDRSGIASLLHSLCYEIEDGDFQREVKWNHDN